MLREENVLRTLEKNVLGEYPCPNNRRLGKIA
jgi:hypothetical protein